MLKNGTTEDIVSYFAPKWNVGSGLIVGSGGLLRPNDNISRAESATVILRLLQKAGWWSSKSRKRENNVRLLGHSGVDARSFRIQINNYLPFFK